MVLGISALSHDAVKFCPALQECVILAVKKDEGKACLIGGCKASVRLTLPGTW